MAATSDRVVDAVEVRGNDGAAPGWLERPVGPGLKWVFAGAAVALGIALRIFMSSHAYFALESDEAITGLMARHILEGEFPVFFWGQSYGGTIEAFLTAGVFAVTGSSTAAMRVVPTVLFAAAAVIMWFVGKRTVGEPAATIAAALIFFWPMWIVWKSTRAHGFYGVLLVLAMLFLLFTLRADEKPSQWHSFALGLIGGAGWWTSPQMALVAAPCLVWLLGRRKLRHPIVMGASAIVGALPWLLWNARNSWDSMKLGENLPETTYLEHLKTFFTDVFPIALALRAPETPGWLFPSLAFGWALLIVALVALGYAAWRGFRAGGPLFLLVGAIVVYPFLYSLSPHTWYISEPRYLILLLPFICLTFGWLLSRSAAATVLVGSFMAVLSIAGTVVVGRGTALTPDISLVVVPENFEPLIETLEDHGIRYVSTNYWIAYRLSFETDERIIATDPGFARIPAYNDAVMNAPDAAHVFLEGTPEDAGFREDGGAKGHDRVETGGFVIYIPVT